MNPNLTVSYMAEQTSRARLDRVAAHGCLVDEATAARSRATAPARLPVVVGAALVRLGERLQGTAQPDSTTDASPALAAR
ncbi:MAG: hypothetical protein M3Q03_12585 [Chloroflexota bacterium]|nr:hypothetical protein [Chloroflexota bacterium]